MNEVWLCFKELCGVNFVNEVHSHVHCSLENLAKALILWVLCFFGKFEEKIFQGRTPPSAVPAHHTPGTPLRVLYISMQSSGYARVASATGS